ncbi:MAG: RNA polymerase sigma factor [Actinomycetota bacterium]|nr:RNA polymerase sigma factor [Actinomycetota bacterium]
MSEASDVYRRHADELVRYATALVGPAEAPDVVVDAALAAFRSPGWPAVGNQRAYLYRAVLNRALSVRRSDGRRAAREARVAALDAAERRAPAVGAAAVSSVDAQRALAALSAQQRAVIYLTYWDDQTPAQVAAMLGVGEGTVRKQLARAREQLRRILDEH